MRVAPALIVMSFFSGVAWASESRPDGAKCEGRPDVHQARRSAPARPQRLDQLPPGNLELAVWRQVGQCRVAAIVRYDVAPVRR